MKGALDLSAQIRAGLRFRASGLQRILDHTSDLKESSMSAGLDRIDQKILRLLQADGRMANAEIAERVGTSAATCHRRIQRLFAEGFVRAVRALIDPMRVGRGTLVFVGVVLDRSTPESFSEFEAAVRAIPVLLDCHLVAGDFDYMLKIRVSDMADFNRLHSATLIGLPGVRQTRTFFVMKEVIDNAPLDL
jgi:Lrp/AsnC family transcriptional regulator, leucine-responsive regulatory protein